MNQPLASGSEDLLGMTLKAYNMKHYLLTALVLLASTMHPSFANDNVKIVDIGLAGNGCPEEPESMSTILIKQDDRSVRIISPHFVLPGKPPLRTLVRYKCDVAVSVEVGKGYQVGIKASAKAFIELHDASKSTVSLDAFFTGTKSKREEIKLSSPTHQNLEISNNETVWSECGADTILRMKIAATLRGKDLGQSYLRVNSFGMEFEQRACSST